MGKEVLDARTMQVRNYKYITIHMNDVDNLFGARAVPVICARTCMVQYCRYQYSA